jgi:hypothetical protein
MDAARRGGIAPKHAHDIITPQEAVHLVSEHVGGAILTKPTALGFRAEGVVVKPRSDPSLCFQTCVIMRTDDDSRLANEFARSFLRRYAPQRLPTKPVGLSRSVRVVNKKDNRSAAPLTRRSGACRVPGPLILINEDRSLSTANWGYACVCS